jgi:hypothetical protein
MNYEAYRAVKEAIVTDNTKHIDNVIEDHKNYLDMFSDSHNIIEYCTKMIKTYNKYNSISEYVFTELLDHVDSSLYKGKLFLSVLQNLNNTTNTITRYIVPFAYKSESYNYKIHHKIIYYYLLKYDKDVACHFIKEYYKYANKFNKVIISYSKLSFDIDMNHQFYMQFRQTFNGFEYSDKLLLCTIAQNNLIVVDGIINDNKIIIRSGNGVTKSITYTLPDTIEICKHDPVIVIKSANKYYKIDDNDNIISSNISVNCHNFIVHTYSSAFDTLRFFIDGEHLYVERNIGNYLRYVCGKILIPGLSGIIDVISNDDIILISFANSDIYKVIKKDVVVGFCSGCLSMASSIRSSNDDKTIFNN